MSLTYDKAKLDALVSEHRSRPGIADIRVWINSGELKTGDDIMRVVVAGRFRTDVFPVFESLISHIKGEVVDEHEGA
jgi:molybdopterin synthase catalytic subunit